MCDLAQEDTGRYHTVSLASDGTAMACGSSEPGECNIPALSGGIIYTQAAVVCGYTVLLMSDSTAVVCDFRQWKFPASSNCCWRHNIPILPDDVVCNSMSGTSKQFTTTKRPEQRRSAQQGTGDPEQTATPKRHRSRADRKNQNTRPGRSRKNRKEADQGNSQQTKKVPGHIETTRRQSSTEDPQARARIQIKTSKMQAETTTQQIMAYQGRPR